MLLLVGIRLLLLLECFDADIGSGGHLLGLVADLYEIVYFFAGEGDWLIFERVEIYVYVYIVLTRAPQAALGVEWPAPTVVHNVYRLLYLIVSKIGRRAKNIYIHSYSCILLMPPTQVSSFMAPLSSGASPLPWGRPALNSPL